MASTMKAWQYSKISGKLEDSITLNTSIPIPTASSLSKNDLLVEVLTAALNPVDYKLPESNASIFMISKPATPGLDFCGRVKAKHTSNDLIKEGQLIFGCLGSPRKYGTCGEYIVVPRSECALLPEGVDIDEAAAVGTAGMTAYQALLPDHVKAGSNIFINGGSGGVGTFGIQFAKAMGAKVTTTCSTLNVELCKSLGADEVIDYKTADIVATLKGKGQIFDAVIDNVGDSATLFNECEALLKPDGVFVQVAMKVTVAGVAGMMRKRLQPRLLGGVGRKFHFVAVEGRTRDFEHVGKWMKEGKVKAVIGETFAFEEVPKAFEHLRTGHTKGKIVIHVGEK
ncbi:zinc-binding oxidoreductase [Cadophora sp. DSE1049]|nr:zinc-binding oxidoreductase [Cadophora sp. DSE1049]